MDYEKLYKKALERASKLRVQNPFDTVSQMMEYVFPELKESEDEKVRKSIIAIINNYVDNSNTFKPKMLAWLEKQGQEKHLSEPIKDYQGSFTCWNNAHDFRPKHLQRCICYDKYMGGVYCYVYDDISKYWCTQTTEEHDSDGDNHISDYADYRITLWMPLPDTSFCPSKSLLEKQGENPQDKGEISDGYHTFNELYYYRMLYNAAFFNMLPKEWVHKSKKHHDGEDCFGGGWFIVMANLPTGQISNHYELKNWDLFQIPEKEVADKWDGHTPQEAADRLHKYLLEKQGEQKPIANVEPKFKVGDWVTIK